MEHYGDIKPFVLDSNDIVPASNINMLLSFRTSNCAYIFSCGLLQSFIGGPFCQRYLKMIDLLKNNHNHICNALSTLLGKKILHKALISKRKLFIYPKIVLKLQSIIFSSSSEEAWMCPWRHLRSHIFLSTESTWNSAKEMDFYSLIMNPFFSKIYWGTEKEITTLFGQVWWHWCDI